MGKSIDDSIGSSRKIIRIIKPYRQEDDQQITPYNQDVVRVRSAGLDYRNQQPIDSREHPDIQRIDREVSREYLNTMIRKK